MDVSLYNLSHKKRQEDVNGKHPRPYGNSAYRCKKIFFTHSNILEIPVDSLEADSTGICC